MSPGNPKHHTPWLLCRFLHDLLALKRPARKWGPGGNWVGCKMACFGWNTHPSAQGSSTLTPLSPQDSPLDPFRGVSSCEGPGGQTWKNTCKARVRLSMAAGTHDVICMAEAPPWLCSSTAWLVEEEFGIPWIHGSTRGVCGNLGDLQLSGKTKDYSTPICNPRLPTTSQWLVKWKLVGFFPSLFPLFTQ